MLRKEVITAKLPDDVKKVAIKLQQRFWKQLHINKHRTKKTKTTTATVKQTKYS